MKNHITYTATLLIAYFSLIWLCVGFDMINEIVFFAVLIFCYGNALAYYELKNTKL